MAEFRDEGMRGFWNWENEPESLADYIKKTEDNAAGRGLTEGWVPSSTFWLVDKGEFKGHVNIRHRLNDYLAKVGGNIGYYIRPTARAQGYGTKILKLALEKARELGLQRAMIGCNESNIASKKVIEKNGGKFERKVVDEEEPKLIYWIELR